MPQDATLPLQGRVGELEERIHVLMCVEAQPEQLVLPSPFVDRDGTHAQALRRLSRREQWTDLGLDLGAVHATAVATLVWIVPWSRGTIDVSLLRDDKRTDR